MANHVSAKKRARQNIVRRAHNKGIISNVRSTIKDFSVCLSDNSKEPTKVYESFQGVQSTLHKAVSKGLVHKNTASRKISRLSALMTKTLETR